MNTKRSTALAATVAIAAALALISAAMFSGVQLTTTEGLSSSSGPTSTTATGQPQSTTQTSSQQPSSQVTSSQQSTTGSTTQSANQQDQGSFSVLLTDPPNVPGGTTGVFVSYADLAVHLAGAANDSGWTVIKSSGSIELLGTVNASVTLTSVKIDAGRYNQIRFNITGTVVTYGGQNYTTFVQTSELTVPIVNGVGVNVTGPSATIIDISPTVINVGSQIVPEFIVNSVATAYPVPSSSVTGQVEVEGATTSLTGASWWQTIEQHSTVTLSIGSASLNSTYLHLNVANTGTNSTVLNLVTITPIVNATAAATKGVLPTALGQSAIFIVLKNGTLVQFQLLTNSKQPSAVAISSSLFAQRGLQLPPGATASLTHHGVIILGFLGTALLPPVGKIIAGHQYVVTVIGAGAAASVVVTAS